MKKTLVLSLLCFFALISCGKNSSEYKGLKAQYDSIAMLQECVSRELSQTDSLVASVLVNFQDIESVENMINLSPRQGELRKSERERIKDNMMIIAQKLKSNSEIIDALSNKLTEVENHSTGLHKTLQALKKTFKNQEMSIAKLNVGLKKRNIIIWELDSMVNNLNIDIEKLNDQADEQRLAIEEQEAKLNQVLYCIGTDQDLEDMKILVKGKVEVDNANRNYFTKTDLRELHQLLTYSKDAKILTIHPKSSYELVKDKEGKIILKIKNQISFWSLSKLLLIQVD